MRSAVVKSGARGGGITLVAQGVKIAILMVSVVILSRLLPPEDFGLVAMVAVLVAVGELLRDFGLSTAGLRAPVLSNQQASNLFWANSFLGLVGSILMAVAAPVLVWIYGEPRLLLLTPILASSLLLNGVQAQLQVHLSRNLRFLALNVTDVLSQLVGLLVAIVAAYLGLGYWALVFQTLSATVCLLVTRAICAKWKPLLPARDGETLPLLKQGADYAGTQLLTYISSNIDTVMIGSIWGATKLGFYDRAYQLLTVPVGRLMSPLTNVVIPSMNGARRAGEDLVSHFLRLQALAGFGVTAVFCVGVSVADTLVPFVLGAGWEQTIPLFQILAIGGAAKGLSQVSFWIFLIEGQSRELLRYNLVTKIITIVSVVFASFISLEATAWALSLCMLLSWPVNIVWLGRTAGLPVRKFLINGFRYLGSGAFASIAMIFISFESLPLGEFWIILLRSIVSFLIFVGLLCLTRQGRMDFVQMRNALRNLTNNG